MQHIPPLAADVLLFFVSTFYFEPAPLDDPRRGHVGGVDFDVDAVGVQFLPGIIDHHGDGFRHVAVAPLLLLKGEAEGPFAGGGGEGGEGDPADDGLCLVQFDGEVVDATRGVVFGDNDVREPFAGLAFVERAVFEEADDVVIGEHLVEGGPVGKVDVAEGEAGGGDCCQFLSPMINCCA